MRYYVFDAYDCFGDYATLEEAAGQAAFMIADELTGVEIKYMTQEQFEHYCKTGTDL